MRRAPARLLTAVSLLPCAAVAALWADASVFGGTRTVVFGSKQAGVTLFSMPDGIAFCAGDLLATRFPTIQVYDWTVPGIYYRAIAGPSQQNLLVVWHFIAFTATALPPAAWFAWRRLSARRRRPRPGRCRSCGYDLRVAGAVPRVRGRERGSGTMKRALPDLLAGASLLLCVATGVLWVRSFFVLDAVDTRRVNDPPTTGMYVQAFSSRGAISVRRFDVAVQGAAPPGYRVDEGIRLDVGTRLRWRTDHAEPWRLERYRYGMGFSAHDGSFKRRPRPDVTQVERDRGVTFPHWVPLLVTAPPPVWWLRRFRAAKARRRRWLCAT